MTTPQLSIIICTHNRPAQLRDALASVCEQDLAGEQYEIIVVDNASTQPVGPVVAAAAERWPDRRLRLIGEPRAGLGHARNAGVAAAGSELVAFLDDDAKTGPEYVRLAVAVMTGQRPDAECAGGVIEPFYTSEKPAWFDDRWESWSWGPAARVLTRGESFIGSNMIWRKAALLAAGGFATDVGVAGDTLSVGEETAVFDRRWAGDAAPVFWYEPALRVMHWTPAYKMTVRYRLKRFVVRGMVAAKPAVRRGTGPRLALLAASLGAVVVHAVLAVVKLPAIRPWQRWMVVAWEGAAARTGMVLETLGIRPRVRQG